MAYEQLRGFGCEPDVCFDAGAPDCEGGEERDRAGFIVVGVAGDGVDVATEPACLWVRVRFVGCPFAHDAVDVVVGDETAEMDVEVDE